MVRKVCHKIIHVKRNEEWYRREIRRIDAKVNRLRLVRFGNNHKWGSM